MADPAVVTMEDAAPAIGGQAEQRVAVATQWQLMWWRFRKHRLAMIGTAVRHASSARSFGSLEASSVAVVFISILLLPVFASGRRTGIPCSRNSTMRQFGVPGTPS